MRRSLPRHVAIPFLAAFAALAACSSDPQSPDLESQLEKDTGASWTVYTDPRSNEVRFLAPKTPVHIGSGTPEENARAFFTRYRDSLHASGRADEIRLVGSATDSRGNLHIRFAHFLPGTELPVFGAGSTAHFTADGAVYWLETDFRADLADVDGNASVTKEAAADAAIAHVLASCDTTGALPVAAATDLGVLSDPDTHATLAYRVAVTAPDSSCLAPAVLVDARTGAPIKIEEGAHSVQDPTVGGSLFFRLKDFRDVKPISVTAVSGSSSKFQMVSSEPALRVLTRSFGTGAVIQTNDIAHWDESSSAKGAAADAHFHTHKALPFLRSFAANFDAHGKGGLVFPLSLDVNATVHDQSKANDFGSNAFATIDPATKGDIIHFGDGNVAKHPNELPYSAAYDVVAHELTHLITFHTSNLKYENQSGALNESFSDVMGAAAEHAESHDDAKSFLIGEDLFVKGVDGKGQVLRSMTAPRSTAGVDHMSDLITCPKNAAPTRDNDMCGVHSNSGIANRAFSLIVQGGAVMRFPKDAPPVMRPVGVTTGIGWERATELTYWAMTGLTATATFENAALAQMAEASRTLDPVVEQAVVCAWHAVGVLAGSDELEKLLGSTVCMPWSPPAPPPGPAPVNFCEGHGDALVCDPAAGSQAIQCKGGLTVPNDTEFCADPNARCKSVSASDITALRTPTGELDCE
ncbi:neutral metalloprotease NprE [soil metagenome]